MGHRAKAPFEVVRATMCLTLSIWIAVATACDPVSVSVPSGPTATPFQTPTPIPTSTKVLSPTSTPNPIPTSTLIPPSVIGKWQKIVGGQSIIDLITFYDDGTVVAVVDLKITRPTFVGKYSFLNASHSSLRIDNVDPLGPLVYDLKFDTPDQLQLIGTAGDRTVYIRIKP